MDLTQKNQDFASHRLTSLLPYIALCLCFTVLSGYRFCDDGRFFFGDSSIHAPFIMLKWNPGLFQGDLVREGQQGFVTLFFSFYGTITRNIGQLEAAYFISFVLFNFLIMLSLSKLFFLLCRDEAASFFAVACLYFGFVPVLGGNFPYNELVHSTVALPLVIAGLYFFFKKQYVLCGTLLGLATDFHGIYALFAFIAVWIHFMLGFSSGRNKLREIFLFTAVFVFFSLPIFIMKSGQVESPVPLQEWMTVLSLRAYHHFFPQLWGAETYIRFFIFTGFFILGAAQTETGRLLQTWKKELAALFFMVLFMISAGTFFVLVVPVRLAIELTGYRATLFFIMLAYPFILFSLFQQFKEKKLSLALPAALAMCTLLSNYYTNLLLLSFMTLLASRLFQPRFSFLRNAVLTLLSSAFFLMLARHVFIYLWKGNVLSTFYFLLQPHNADAFKIAKLVLFLAISLVSFFLSARHPSDRAETGLQFRSSFLAACVLVSLCKIMFMGTSSFYVRTTQEYRQVQDFVRLHTPAEALILVPPYLTSFRTYSERGIYTDFKSGTYSSYNPLYARLWWQRISDLGITTADTGFMKKAYNNLPAKKINALSIKYSLQFFVTESKMRYPFPVVFKNSTYTVYQL